MWTKKQLIDAAYSELGYAPDEYDLSDEQYASALRQLDSMMAYFWSIGIKVNYWWAVSRADDPLTAADETCEPSIDHKSGITEESAYPIYVNLAMRLAPSLGKNPSQDLRSAASMTKDKLLADATKPCPGYLPAGVPMGAGWENQMTTSWLYGGFRFSRNPQTYATSEEQDDG